MIVLHVVHGSTPLQPAAATLHTAALQPVEQLGQTLSGLSSLQLQPHLVVAHEVGAVGGAQHHAVDGAALLGHHPVLLGRAQLLQGQA